MIRAAKLEDLDAIIALGLKLHAASVYGDMPFDEAKVRDVMGRLVEGEGVIFLGFLSTPDSERVVGGIAGGVCEHWFNHVRHGFEYAFFIDQEHRSGTMALRLLCAFERWCAIHGVKQVRLGDTAGVDPAGVARFYQFAGYRRSGQIFTKDI